MPLYFFYNEGVVWRSGLQVWLVTWRSLLRAHQSPTPLFAWARNFTLID